MYNVSDFVKVWDKPENAEKKCPIACYKLDSMIYVLQYGENDFRPPVNHIMHIVALPKSFESLEEAVAYMNSDDWE